MTLAHVCLRYPPSAGGVEDYARNLVERLRAAGDDVHVHTTALRTHHPATFLSEPLRDPPYVHRYPVQTFSFLAYPIPRGLERSLGTGNLGLIHAHAFWYAPTDIASRVAARHGLPFVLSPYFGPRSKTVWKVYRVLRGNRTIARADAVVVISPQEESALLAAGFRPRRVVLAPPGIEPAEFNATPAGNPFRARGIPEGPTLFYAGRISLTKGIDLLLRALPSILRAFPDARCALAGEDFGARGALERLTVELGVSGHVFWLGRLPRAELLAAYAHSDVFVFPSRHEAFGIAALEAQAAGTPVVALNAASLPYVVADGETGFLVPPEDAGSLTRSILRLLSDRDLAARLGTAGRERARRRFRWETTVRILRELYASLQTARDRHAALPRHVSP